MYPLGIGADIRATRPRSGIQEVIVEFDGVVANLTLGHIAITNRAGFSAYGAMGPDAGSIDVQPIAGTLLRSIDIYEGNVYMYFLGNMFDTLVGSHLVLNPRSVHASIHYSAGDPHINPNPVPEGATVVTFIDFTNSFVAGETYEFAIVLREP